MDVVVFRLRGRFAHFLRAETNVSALSYPVPPRTALLGLLGAVLGLDKDEPAVRLADARLAVAGRVPDTHLHMANLRKTVGDGSLPARVRRPASDKAPPRPGAPPRVTQINQEWLLQPDYRVFAALPGSLHEELADRLARRRSVYQPCLGLSELLARLEIEARTEAAPAPEGWWDVSTVCRRDAVTLDASRLARSGARVQQLAMPRAVTTVRVFSHATYLLELEGRPLPVRTAEAWTVGAEQIVFL